MNNRKQELTARVLGDILSLIQKRAYEPGERLPSERELSERFHVGRGVVREALSVLERLRYLNRKPNAGIYLTTSPEQISLETLGLFSELGISLASDKLAEALEVRYIIEMHAVDLACARRTDDDLALLESIVGRFEKSDSFSPADVSELDFEFHMALFKAAHNTVLTQLVTPFYIMSAARRTIYFSDVSRCQKSHKQHQQLIASIRQRDVSKAQSIMTAHITRVEDQLRSD